jgi:hypothetical protein
VVKLYCTAKLICFLVVYLGDPNDRCAQGGTRSHRCGVSNSRSEWASNLKVEPIQQLPSPNTCDSQGPTVEVLDHPFPFQGYLQQGGT